MRQFCVSTITIASAAILSLTGTFADDPVNTTGIIPTHFAEALSLDTPIRQCGNNAPGYADAALSACDSSAIGGCASGSCASGNGMTSKPASLATGFNGLPSTFPNTTRPGTPTGGMSTMASVIDNATFNYIYDAADFRSSGGTPWSATTVSRILRSRDMADIGSFGPGFFCNYDIKLRFELYGETALNSAVVFDPNRLFPQSVQITEFYGSDGNVVVPVDLSDYYDGNEVPVENNVAKVLYQVPSGGKFYFDVIEVDNGGYAGRLVRMEDEDGQGTTISYKAWTEQEVTEAPDRQWQIDTVTGDNGVTATFSYHASQVGGRWAVSQIAVPAWGSLNYTYADGKLAAVSHPDGTQSTFNWAILDVDYDWGTSLLESLEIFDPKASGQHRKKTVYWSASAFANKFEIFNQASQLVRYVLNGDGEVIYLAFGQFPSANIYEGEGILKRVTGNGSVQYHKAGWQFDGQDSGPDPNGYSNISASVTSTGLDLGETFLTGNVASLTGTPSVITDERGVSRTLEYSGTGSSLMRNIEKTTYGDETYETWDHDDFGRVLRHRDRLARVTKFTYDLSGHVLTKEVGILEVTGPAPAGDDSGDGDSGNQGGSTTDGEVSYNAGYESGYNTGYDDGYYSYGYADYSGSTDPDYVTGFSDGYMDGFNDGDGDYYDALYMGLTDYPGSLWHYSYGQSQNFDGGSSGSGNSSDPYYDSYYDDGYGYGYGYDDYDGGGYDDGGGSGGVTEFHDAVQPEHAIYQWDYYPVGHVNAGLLKTEYDAMWDGASADTHRTDYEYNANGSVTKELESASITGGDRPETNYTYDTLNRLATTTNPAGEFASFNYNASNQLIRTTYDDTSTEETLYGTPGSGNEGLVVKTKDRRNIVTTYSYDLSGRKTQVTIATARDADILDGNADDSPITDRNEQSITTYQYQNGTGHPVSVTRDGSRTDFAYDHRGRTTETKAYPYAGKTLISKVAYETNQQQYTEDPYGRRVYKAYRVSDGAMVREVREAYPGAIDAEIAANDKTPIYTTGYDAGYAAGYTASSTWGYDWIDNDPPYDSGNQYQDLGYIAGKNDGLTDGYADAYLDESETSNWMASYGNSFFVPVAEVNGVLLALPRDENLNPKYVIKDMVQDAGGDTIQIFDERGTEHSTVLNTRSQIIRETKAVGTPVEAITEMDYDEDGNVTETRSPRYFDSTDTNGYQKCKTVMTYDGQGRVLTRTEAPGTPEAATESYAYDSEGRQVTRTDARGKIWTTTYASCCGHSVSSTNPRGHGAISNRDNGGLVTHTAGIGDVATHTTLLDPIDAKTFRETTERYNALGRSITACIWLVPQGVIDPENPPIAGFDGIGGQDGLTSQTLYDVDLTDGVGLDSAGGVTVINPLGGTYTVSVSAALSKMAEPIVQGGANTTFNANASGSAIVSLNAENRVTFSISDTQGNTIISGTQHPHDPLPGNTQGGLLTWSCKVHNSTEQLGNGETVLATTSIDALGYATKTRRNGLGHVLETIDQLGFASTIKYDGSGNAVERRDTNNTGYDMVYDRLNRNTSMADKVGSQTQSAYNKAGQKVNQTDAKGNSVLHQYGLRGQATLTTNRLGGTNQFICDENGNRLSVTDSESQVTYYEYDDCNLPIRITYPDHVLGSPAGANGHGVTMFSYDAMNRRDVFTDQLGETQKLSYDLAGRLTSRDYRTAANSPAGTIASADSFTYDAAFRLLTAHSTRYSNLCSWTYDDAGRSNSESLSTGGQTYTVSCAHDETGRITQLTHPDGTVSVKEYTDRGQLEQLVYDGTVIETRSYDDGQRVTASVLGNGITDSRSYNSDNTLAAISSSNTDIGTYSYTWDANKNKTGETITGALAAYGFTTGVAGYDNEGRLAEYMRPGSPPGDSHSQQWVLSPEGDWDSFTTDGVTQSRTHGAGHEVDLADASLIAHDAKGNVTSKPSSLNPIQHSLLSWDSDNRLVTVDENSDGAVDATHGYDALGRRVSKNSTVYVAIGQQVVAEYELGAPAGSPSQQYVYGVYVDEPVVKISATGLEYYHRDQRYSVIALSNNAGSAVEHYAYDAYGTVKILAPNLTTQSASAVGNSYMFTGRRYEHETGDHYFRARYYDSKLGRFMGRDPLGYQDSMSMYRASFVPNRTDPSGLCPEGPLFPNAGPGFPKPIMDFSSSSPDFGFFEGPVFGFVDSRYHLDCRCVERAPGCACVTCDLSVDMELRILVGEIIRYHGSVDGGILENMIGVYGHEQLHWRNHWRFVHDLLLPILCAGEGCQSSKSLCEARAAILQGLGQSMIATFEYYESEHQSLADPHSIFDPEPINGLPYTPIDNIWPWPLEVILPEPMVIAPNPFLK